MAALRAPPNCRRPMYEAARNGAADPVAFAADVAGRTRGAVWLVAAQDYRTYGERCDRLDTALAAVRGGRERVLPERDRYVEQQSLVRFPARA